MWQRWVLAAVTVATAPALASCDPLGGEPSLPVAVPLRADGDQLEIWTGPPCRDVTKIVVTFPGEQPSVRTVLDAAVPRDVEHITLGAAVAGFAVTEPLPAGFDWRERETVSVGLKNSDGSWTVHAATAPVAQQSAEHGGEYYLEGSGWLTPDEVLEGDGDDFLTLCTPDPERSE